MSKLYYLLQSIINKVKNTEKSLESVPKTVNGVEPDENGNVTVSSSWNDLTDKPFYCDLELIDTATGTSSSKWFKVNPTNYYPICIEINGTKFYDLTDYTGDGDSSLWADGGGMGFYIDRNRSHYDIYIDTARYGNIADAKIKMYHQVISKTLPSHYLPVPDYNRMGGVKVNMFDDPVSAGYCECAVGPDGTLYSKEFLATKYYSELSIENLFDMDSNTGDHRLFMDSIANEISDVVDLTLPVHAWYTGPNYSSTPYKYNFIIESADGTTWHMVTTSSNTVHSVTKIASSGVSQREVEVWDNDDGQLESSSDYWFIGESVDHGYRVSVVYGPYMLPLVQVLDDAFVFSTIVDNRSIGIKFLDNGEIQRIDTELLTSDNINALIDERLGLIPTAEGMDF